MVLQVNMAADRRRLQVEIDRTIKKVNEGVEAFADVWHKVILGNKKRNVGENKANFCQVVSGESNRNAQCHKHEPKGKIRTRA